VEKIILAKENQDGGASNLIFRFRGTSNEQRPDGRASIIRLGHSSAGPTTRTKQTPTHRGLTPTRGSEASGGIGTETRGTVWRASNTQRGQRCAGPDGAEETKHQLHHGLRPSGLARLAEGLEQRKRGVDGGEYDDQRHPGGA
jgi:hypothetical protein